MANDIGCLLDASKRNELAKRLSSAKVDQILPAEMELAVLWGLHKLGGLEIEPTLAGSGRKPDALSSCLFPGKLTYVEIAALSNARLSGDTEMSRVSSQISQFANQVSKRAGEHLFFTFNYANDFEEGKIYRKRLANPIFMLDDEAKDSIRNWLETPPDARKRLRLVSTGTDVFIEWKDRRQSFRNYFSPMPSEAQKIDDNPLWERLKDKASQLSGVPFGSLKCLVLADAGSSLLYRLTHRDHQGRTFNGSQIITDFLRRYPDSFHVVCIFSPQRASSGWYGLRGPLHWKVSYVPTHFFDQDVKGLEQLAAALPPPEYEGYQARTLQQQQSFELRGRGLYSDPRWIFKGDKVTIHVSSRAVLALLAGKITHDQFLKIAGMDGDKPKLFANILNRGDILKSVSLISGGLDEDDDKLQLDFEPDPAFKPILDAMRATQGSSGAE